MAKVILDTPRQKVNRFSAWVLWMLRTSGKTQKELAAYIGVDQAGVSRKVKGQTPWKLKEFYQVQEFFGEEFKDE